MHIDKSYLDTNFKKYSSLFEAMRLNCSKEYELNMTLWLVSYYLQNNISRKQEFIYTLFMNKLNINYAKQITSFPYSIFEQANTKIFDILLKHNIMVGASHLLPVELLRMSATIDSANKLSVLDISSCKKFISSNNQFVLLKSDTTGDVIRFHHDLFLRTTNDPYGFFIEFLQISDSTDKLSISNFEIFKLIDYLNLDTELLTIRYLSKYLGDVDYFNSTSPKYQQLCRHQATFFLELFYDRSQIQKELFLYALHQDVAQIVYNLKHVNVEVCELPTFE